MFNIICWKGLFNKFWVIQKQLFESKYWKIRYLVNIRYVLQVNFESTLISNNNISKLLGIIEPHVQSFM